jgi:hypothetical protein
MKPKAKRRPMQPAHPPPRHLQVREVVVCDSSDSDDWGEWAGSKTEEATGWAAKPWRQQEEETEEANWVGSKTDEEEDENEAAIRSSINSWTEWKDMELHEAILQGIYDVAEAKRAQLTMDDQTKDDQTIEEGSEQPKQKYWKKRGTSTRGGSL